MYFGSELRGMLVREFGADDESVSNAVDNFLAEVVAGKYLPSAVLADNNEDIMIEGDLEADAEHVYDTQKYWDLPDQEDTPVPSVENVDLPLAPWEEALLREDGEL